MSRNIPCPECGLKQIDMRNRGCVKCFGEWQKIHLPKQCKNVGWKHTPEALEKMRNAIRPPKTLEHRRKISEAHKRSRLRPISVKGIKRTIETRERVSLAKRGEKNPNWKGGVTPLIIQVRNSRKMAIWRSQVFSRDDFTCQACGKRGGYLQADHELPFALFPDQRFELLNGRTLCRECHHKMPTHGNNKNPWRDPAYMKELYV